METETKEEGDLDPKPYQFDKEIHRLITDENGSDVTSSDSELNSCSLHFSTSSTSSMVSTEDEKDATNSDKPRKRSMKTKGELDLDELPKVEDLAITAKDEDLCVIGSVASVVNQLVVIHSLKESPALDIESILFFEDGKPLGQIFDVFGPVVHPFYVVRFNSEAEIKEKGITVDMKVFFAPEDIEATAFVFVNHLKTVKGSDASWADNNEPPENCIEYSDDEQEKTARMKQRAKNRVVPDSSVTDGDTLKKPKIYEKSNLSFSSLRPYRPSLGHAPRLAPSTPIRPAVFSWSTPSRLGYAPNCYYPRAPVPPAAHVLWPQPAVLTPQGVSYMPQVHQYPMQPRIPTVQTYPAPPNFIYPAGTPPRPPPMYHPSYTSGLQPHGYVQPNPYITSPVYNVPPPRYQQTHLQNPPRVANVGGTTYKHPGIVSSPNIVTSTVPKPEKPIQSASMPNIVVGAPPPALQVQPVVIPSCSPTKPTVPQALNVYSPNYGPTRPTVPEASAVHSPTYGPTKPTIPQAPTVYSPTYGTQLTVSQAPTVYLMNSGTKPSVPTVYSPSYGTKSTVPQPQPVYSQSYGTQPTVNQAPALFSSTYSTKSTVHQASSIYSRPAASAVYSQNTGTTLPPAQAVYSSYGTKQTVPSASSVYSPSYVTMSTTVPQAPAVYSPTYGPTNRTVPQASAVYSSNCTRPTASQVTPTVLQAVNGYQTVCPSPIAAQPWLNPASAIPPFSYLCAPVAPRPLTMNLQPPQMAQRYGVIANIRVSQNYSLNGHK